MVEPRKKQLGNSIDGIRACMPKTYDMSLEGILSHALPSIELDQTPKKNILRYESLLQE